MGSGDLKIESRIVVPRKFVREFFEGYADVVATQAESKRDPEFYNFLGTLVNLFGKFSQTSRQTQTTTNSDNREPEDSNDADDEASRGDNLSEIIDSMNGVFPVSSGIDTQEFLRNCVNLGERFATGQVGMTDLFSNMITNLSNNIRHQEQSESSSSDDDFSDGEAELS